MSDYFLFSGTEPNFRPQPAEGRHCADRRFEAALRAGWLRAARFIT